jgi:hypothetical protein
LPFFIFLGICAFSESMGTDAAVGQQLRGPILLRKKKDEEGI